MFTPFRNLMEIHDIRYFNIKAGGDTEENLPADKGGSL